MDHIRFFGAGAHMPHGIPTLLAKDNDKIKNEILKQSREEGAKSTAVISVFSAFIGAPTHRQAVITFLSDSELQKENNNQFSINLSKNAIGKVDIKILSTVSNKYIEIYSINNNISKDIHSNLDEIFDSLELYLTNKQRNLIKSIRKK